MPLLNYITWNVSPWLYEGEHFAIGWYGTLWTLGLIGILVTYLLTFKHDKMPVNYALVSFMVTLVSVIFFGHLFQGLFYEWYYTADEPLRFLGTDWHYRNHYFEHPLMFLTFTHGGFASHGVLVGVIVAGWIMSKILTCRLWYVADRGMLGVFWVAVGVRIGNILNHEICGIATTLPWGVQFAGSAEVLHPTQIYELLTYLLTLVVGWYLFLRKNGGEYNGLISGVMMTIVLSLRIWIEFYKQVQMEIELNWTLSMGQLLSIPFAICSIWLICYAIEKGQSVLKPSLPTMSRAEKRRLKKR